MQVFNAVRQPNVAGGAGCCAGWFQDLGEQREWEQKSMLNRNLKLCRNLINARPLLGTLVLSVLSTNMAWAISLGQMDDFEDGSRQDWMVGRPGTQPSNIATGGPAGVDDNFLQYNSTGTGGPNSRLIIYNEAQWSGDYLAAGVSEITMDVFNLSTFQPLNLRLALGNDFNANSGSWFVSTDSIDIAPGVGWTSVTFSLAASDLTSVQGVGNYQDVLSSVVVLRILSNSVPETKGETINAMLSVDNITATPEPATVVLILSSLALIRRR